LSCQYNVFSTAMLEIFQPMVICHFTAISGVGMSKKDTILFSRYLKIRYVPFYQPTTDYNGYEGSHFFMEQNLQQTICCSRVLDNIEIMLSK